MLIDELRIFLLGTAATLLADSHFSHRLPIITLGAYTGVGIIYGAQYTYSLWVWCKQRMDLEGSQSCRCLYRRFRGEDFTEPGIGSYIYTGMLLTAHFMLSVTTWPIYNYISSGGRQIFP